MVLAERNVEIPYRFSEEFDVSFEESDLIFTETRRWLWLCAQRIDDFKQGKVETPRMPLASQAQVIDLMWHTFLLFTKEYAEFCDRHFGFFIHHFPLSRADKMELARAQQGDPEAYKKKRTAELKPVYEYIFDQLGPEVLIRWLEEFPEKYSFIS